MARPSNPGLEYFPLDVDFANDDKFAAIEIEHGLPGFSVVIRLFSEVYRVGYCYRWGLPEKKFFAHKIRADVSHVEKIVDTAIECGLFDSDMYQNHGILTSRGIQRRYVTIKKQKISAVIKPEYDLLSARARKDNPGIVREFPGDCSGIVRSKSEQSKVKESKVKESKECVSVDSLSRVGIKATDPEHTHTFGLVKNERIRGMVERSLSKLGDSIDPSKKAAVKLFSTFFDFENFDPENSQVEKLNRLPMRKFPDIYLSPPEFSDLLSEFRAAGIPDQEFKRPFQKVQRRLNDWKIKNKDPAQADCMVWLSTWAKADTVDELRKEKKLILG